MQRIQHPVQHGLTIPGRVVVHDPYDRPGGIVLVPREAGDGTNVLEIAGFDTAFALHAFLPEPTGHGTVHGDYRHGGHEVGGERAVPGVLEDLYTLASGNSAVAGQAGSIVDHHAGSVDALVLQPVVDHPDTGNAIVLFILFPVFGTDREQHLAGHDVTAPFVDVPNHGNQVR